MRNTQNQIVNRLTTFYKNRVFVKSELKFVKVFVLGFAATSLGFHRYEPSLPKKSLF